MKITATFSTGKTITRNTTKQLTHAYRAVNKWQTFTGFASSQELAHKAASSSASGSESKIFEIEIVEVVII